MGIQPIDLQTLYTQLDKVSKDVAFQQQGVPLKNAIQQEKSAQMLQEQQKTVKQTTNGDELLHVQDRNGRKDDHSDLRKKKQRKAELPPDSEQKNAPEVLKDPALGTRIDTWG
ncbi:MAG: hypothetical protein NC041_05045 [Bacteroides sp.]|nr:hypothetical protein [Prevotella sp.]MCM1407324.1 hypothetical protein [Treponema brennaborense]MCM1469814.1 hypothetical protein [Bacteroides sp.]